VDELKQRGCDMQRLTGSRHKVSIGFTRSRTTAYAAMAAILTLAVAPPASAVPLFQAVTGITNSGVPFGSQSRSGSIDAGAETRFDDNQNGVHALGVARASVLGLGAAASVRLAGDQINTNFGARGTASARFEDFVISGQTGPITTSFNLFLEGTVGALTAGPLAGSISQATAAVIVETRVNGLLITADPFFQDRVSVLVRDGVVEERNTGMLRNWSADPGEHGSLSFTTPSFTVDAGEPFQLELSLIAAGGAFEFMRFGAVTEGFADFDSTLAFPSAGPVFNLPGGYTANSADARILGNQFVGGGAVAVPEPGSIVLLLAAATALGTWRRPLQRRPRAGARG
jgi:hypothetical protein